MTQWCFLDVVYAALLVHRERVAGMTSPNVLEDAISQYCVNEYVQHYEDLGYERVCAHMKTLTREELPAFDPRTVEPEAPVPSLLAGHAEDLLSFCLHVQGQRVQHNPSCAVEASVLQWYRSRAVDHYTQLANAHVVRLEQELQAVTAAWTTVFPGSYVQAFQRDREHVDRKITELRSTSAADLVLYDPVVLFAQCPRPRLLALPPAARRACLAACSVQYMQCRLAAQPMPMQWARAGSDNLSARMVVHAQCRAALAPLLDECHAVTNQRLEASLGRWYSFWGPPGDPTVAGTAGDVDVINQYTEVMRSRVGWVQLCGLLPKVMELVRIAAQP